MLDSRWHQLKRKVKNCKETAWTVALETTREKRRRKNVRMRERVCESEREKEWKLIASALGIPIGDAKCLCRYSTLDDILINRTFSYTQFTVRWSLFHDVNNFQLYAPPTFLSVSLNLNLRKMYYKKYIRFRTYICFYTR